MKYKLAIIGSRDFDNYTIVKDHVLQYKGKIKEIVSGGARGADTLARQLASNSNIPFKEFPADWETHGKKAGYLRNLEIVKYSDCGIAFWDGKSPGTKMAIDLFKKANKPVKVVLI